MRRGPPLGVHPPLRRLAVGRGAGSCPRTRPRTRAVAGMLHDLSTVAAGDPTDHAARSSLLAHEIFERLARFGAADVNRVVHAIARHSKEESVDGPLDEVLKDADVLQHWLCAPARPPHASHAARPATL
ncbi:MAG: HD domain-containing protein [Candidatus Bipolaricaulota bacterium]